MTPTSPSRRLRVAGALVATAALVLALAACGSESDDTSSSDTTAAADTSTTAAGDSTEITSGVVLDEDGLTIANPWARTSPEDTTYGAVYLQLSSFDGDALTGASVPADVAGTVEIHETVATGDAATDTTMAMGGEGSDTTETTMGGMGQMTMQPVDSIELPAGETVTLEPGGYHIMLIDLVAPLESGQEIEVTLTFESAGERTITVPVQDDAP